MRGICLFILTFAGPYPLSQTLHRNVATNGLRRLPETKIINGYLTQPGQFPYHAYVRFPTTNKSVGVSCGGALISKNYVLTAAHCFPHQDELPNSIVWVLLGAWNLGKDESYRLGFKVREYKTHEGWSKTNPHENDLMVVKLPYAINETNYIKPIPISRDVTNTYAGASGVIAGWGVTKENATTKTSILRYATNVIISNEECAKSYSPGKIKDIHLCLSSNGNSGDCRGDSGGGLMVDNYTLVGISSFGNKYCFSGEPSGYVRLTKYLDWIGKHTDVVI